MAGGKGNIRPEDNPKPFKKGNKASLKWTYEKMAELGEQLIEWMQDDNNLTIKSFLAHKGLWRQQYDKLRKRCTTLNVYHARAKMIQGAKLDELALKREIDGTYAKFLGVNYHGMTSDKVKSENKNDNKETIQIIDFSKGD